MIPEPVTAENMAEFFHYCRTYGSENDDSYLEEADLTPEEFHPGENEPAFMLRDKDGEIWAAASLMRHYFNTETPSARLRIFHARGQDSQLYHTLLTALLPQTAGLQSIYLFLPAENQTGLEAVQKIGFAIRRYSLIMERPNIPVAELDFPADFSLHPMDPEHDLEAWCHIRNSAFQVLADFQPLVPQDIRDELAAAPQELAGKLLLWHGDRPVGTVYASTDVNSHEEPSVMVYSLAILPEYQHCGLGRRMLRAAIHWGKEHGLDTAVLSVNAENERAALLYEDEGFVRTATYICLHYPLTA